jgi:hypothetical protein
MTSAEALEFVRSHGVVLESATGRVVSLASAIADGPIRGSWWGHPRGQEIFALTRAVRDCPEVLVCRLVDGRITYLHRRLWPALVRVADRFPRSNLARIHEKHTASGKHVSEEVPYPDWVTSDLQGQARKLGVQEALDALGDWCRNASLPAVP